MYTLVASLCCAAETNTTLQSNYTPIKMISWGFLVFSLLYLFPLVASEEKKNQVKHTAEKNDPNHRDAESN